jgi:hypothetical protein
MEKEVQSAALRAKDSTLGADNNNNFYNYEADLLPKRTNNNDDDDDLIDIQQFSADNQAWLEANLLHTTHERANQTISRNTPRRRIVVNEEEEKENAQAHKRFTQENPQQKQVEQLQQQILQQSIKLIIVNSKICLIYQ